MNRLLFIVFAGFASGISGQEILTLQACLDQVENNSLQIAAESGSLKRAEIARQFHRWTFLPSLNANTGLNTSFGRRLDPFTNTFATSSVNSHSFGINSSVQLFNGFAYFSKLRALNATIEKDETGLKRKQNEWKIRAIETYIALCKLSIRIDVTRSRIEKYQQIQGIQRVLIHEGRINAIDTLKSYHAWLHEQDALANLHQDLQVTTIDLNFQMGKPLKTTYKPDLSSIAAAERIQFDEAYQVKLIELESELLENEWKTQRAKVLPAISLSGLLGTGFSTNNKDYQLAGTPTKPYSRQISENLYEGIGFYLSIPLVNHGEWLQTKRITAVQQEELANRMELARLQLEKQVLELDQKQLDLRAKEERYKQMAGNLETIYGKSLLLYQEGRLTYPELEHALMEWQLRQLEFELIKLDNPLLKLYEY